MLIFREMYWLTSVFVRLLGAMLLLLNAFTFAFADGTIDRTQWLERDPRLSKPVTIVRRHVRVGELIEEAARQSGVALTTNRYDHGDSEVITVYARNIALVDLLSGVWSLVSYQQAAWQWEIIGDGKKTPYAYQLDFPINAREYPLTIRNEVRKHFEESMEASIEVVNGATKERSDLLKAKYPEVKLTEDPTTVAEFKAFASLFPKSERLKLVRGETKGETVLPRNRWTREMEDYNDSSVERMRKNGAWKGIVQGIVLPDTHPDILAVSREQRTADISPMIRFSAGDVGWWIGGGTTTEKYWGETLGERWLLVGDAVTDATRESLKIGEQPARPKQDYRSTFDQPRFRHLNNFNKLTGIPVFLRNADEVAFSPIYNTTVTDFVKSLRERGQSVKWRDGSLFIARPNWVVKSVENADKNFPWPAMKRFRDRLIASKDYNVTLEDIARLAHDTSEAQLEAIGEEEDLLQPNMFLSTKAFCADVARMRPLLAPVVGSHDDLSNPLITDKGVRVRELPKEMRDYLATRFTGTIPSDYRFRIRPDIVSPEKYPEQWKGYSPEGYAFGCVFHFEMGKVGAMRTLGTVTWVPRKVAELDNSRLNPEADLRMSAYRTYGEPSTYKEPEL